MPHVITQSCCSDGSCVYACPVNCIHPSPDDPEFDRVEQLFIDPDTCIGCGACVAACPIDAVFDADRLPARWKAYEQINRDYFTGGLK